MVKCLDMSHLDWHEWFYYDESSPTYLRWKIDKFDTRGQRTAYAQAGNVAGKKNGERSTVLLDGIRYKTQRIIWELFFGSITDDLIVDHEDGNPLNNRLDNLRLIPQPINTRNAKKRTDNQSGVTGVSYSSNGRGTWYWCARWQENLKYKIKRFNVKDFGYDKAFHLACEYRKNMIKELNKNGAGFTERHGT